MLDFSTWQWINEGKIAFEDDAVIMTAPARTDFFCDGAESEGDGLPANLNNAPYFYTEVEGDFVFGVKMKPEFASTYDAGVFMIMHDLDNWVKCCFELSDFGTHAAVSVVTRDGASDDANGVNIPESYDSIWMKACRVGRTFSFHYSLDGEKYNMTRYFLLPDRKSVKLGLVAQSPTGDGGVRVYEDIQLEHKTVKNIRAGV